MPAARSSYRGTGARRRCRRGSSSITIWPTPQRIPRPDRDEGLRRLHRKTAPQRRGQSSICSRFDHRDQFFELARATGANENRIPALKKLFVDAVARTEAARQLDGRIGLLCDDRYGQDALNAATGRGWWVGRPVELPGSNPVVFEAGRSIGTALIAWPVEQVVKCLVPFHPDDDVPNPAGKRSAGKGALRRRARERPRVADRDRAAQAASAWTRRISCAR